MTWRTDTTVKQGLAEIAVAGDNGVFRSAAIDCEDNPLQSNLNAHYHTVEFNALTPKTKYAYRVGDGLNWTGVVPFRNGQ